MAPSHLEGALRTILKDEEFCACPAKAENFKDAIRKLIIYTTSTEENAAIFSKWLYSLMKRIVVGARSVRTGKVNREKLWESFHQIRSTDVFKEKWDEFFARCELRSQPDLYQHVSLIYFKQFIDTVLPVAPINDDATTTCIPEDLSYEEINALRYIGGYIVRSIIEDRSVVISARFLIQDKPSSISPSEEWTCIIDRGGLIHITDGFCNTLSAIEYSIRRQAGTSDFDKDKIQESLQYDSDVLFNWCSAAATVNDEEEKIFVLNLVIKKYITVRGFSFTRSVLETFKQETKKSTSKSKPLRKKISEE